MLDRGNCKLKIIELHLVFTIDSFAPEPNQIKFFIYHLQRERSHNQNVCVWSMDANLSYENRLVMEVLVKHPKMYEDLLDEQKPKTVRLEKRMNYIFLDRGEYIRTNL